MVAAGGGGGAYYSSIHYGAGGDGGTLIGNGATGPDAETTGGTQTGTSFGKAINSTTDEWPGAGGGYYGGNSNKYVAGGGSSFISGYAGVNAITSGGTPSENTKHYSQRVFIKGQMTAGDNTGDGSVRITFIGGSSSNPPQELTKTNSTLGSVRYVKDCIAGSTFGKYMQWVEIQAIENGTNVAHGLTPTVSAAQAETTNEYDRDYENITDGRIDNNAWGEPAEYGLQCAVIDLGSVKSLDEVVVWHLTTGGRTYYSNVVAVSSNGTDWTAIMTGDGPETSNGLRINAWETKSINLEDTIVVNYPYVAGGEYRAFTVPIEGYYYVVTNGAKGGNGANGGSASGMIHLTAGEKLYVYAGGIGATSTSSANAGGWNGGGYGGMHSNGTYGFGGGGATDIRCFVSNGKCVRDDNHLAWNNADGLKARIMVAGGGGAITSNTSYTYSPGGGGGLVGVKGGGSYTASTAKDPTGGTQREGGEYGHTTNTTGSGAFGYAYQSTLTSWGGGGGGGYYGGGTGFGRAGAGGSSFISGFGGSNAITSSSSLTPTNDTLHYSGKYFIDGDTTISANNSNGSAQIRFKSVNEPSRVRSELESVRYIKNCINYNSESNYNHWVEIQALVGGQNVALGATVTGTSAQIDTDRAYSYIVDGMVDNFTDAIGYGRPSGSGNQCVTIDLGQTYDLDEVALWHFFGKDSRIYIDNITSVSSDGTTWTTIDNGGYIETSAGRHISAWDQASTCDDTTGPSVTLTVSTSSSTSITASTSATDQSGVNPLYGYAIGTSSSCGPTTSFNASTNTSHTFSSLTQGTKYYVCVKVADTCGNTTYELSDAVLTLNSSTTFNYSGSQTTYTVPVTGTYQIDTYGAQGGSSTNGTGGNGARVYGTIVLYAGETLYIRVGGQGNNNGSAGWNGGGSTGKTNYAAGGGGGASDVRRGGTALSNRIIIAGGGGGGSGYSACNGGYGGAHAASGSNAASCGLGYGRGGTQSAGGAAPNVSNGYNTKATAGSLGQGGTGGYCNSTVNCGNNAGGGGGGGYYGGSGGEYTSGGGGGSSYVATSSFITYGSTANNKTGNGQIVITYKGPPVSADPLTSSMYTVSSGCSKTTGTDAGKHYIMFTGNCTLTLSQNASVTAFLVGGGGGGKPGTLSDPCSGGRGGGGGSRTSSGLVMTAGTYTITVGAGGASNTAGSASSIKFGNTTILSASGGPTGGGNGGYGSEVQGLKVVDNAATGGGNGARAFSDGSLTTLYGAGGGGGKCATINGVTSSYGNGAGGTTGGGNGGWLAAGSAATANTGSGGGGGGASNDNGSAAGGAGGSGVIIIRGR